jgi:DNA polymerase-3 subunit alpha
VRYSAPEYLKSAAEMALLFRDHLLDEIIEELIENTVEVANKVKPYDFKWRNNACQLSSSGGGHSADTYFW